MNKPLQFGLQHLGRKQGPTGKHGPLLTSKLSSNRTTSQIKNAWESSKKLKRKSIKVWQHGAKHYHFQKTEWNVQPCRSECFPFTVNSTDHSSFLEPLPMHIVSYFVCIYIEMIESDDTQFSQGWWTQAAKWEEKWKEWIAKMSR